MSRFPCNLARHFDQMLAADPVDGDAPQSHLGRDLHADGEDRRRAERDLMLLNAIWWAVNGHGPLGNPWGER